MLTLHDGSADYKSIVPKFSASALPAKVVWADLLNGTPEEIGFIERIIGRHLPTAEELREIESSSRLRFDKKGFCLSTNIVSRIPSGMPEAAPVGFILSRNLLVTVRFDALTAFSTFQEDFEEREAHIDSISAFTGLINAIVDRTADVLENVGNELDQISQAVFFRNSHDVSFSSRPARETENLKETLRRIGYNGHLSSKIRDSLMSVGRIVSYVSDMGADWLMHEQRAHLETQARDISSLSDYDLHLMNKVQLLLDATMGLINIEQNNIIKVLTVVSVVGVPPTLVASMYGMNFHFMPELGWEFGYPFGLLLIALSAIGPVLWFKLRGWL
ncbi:MAG: magnesium transporter CorA family protein [Alphaproteobacteria bacterium]|nr:magnesium transporter CorA family protein [Alphaproteobacteria bacterium]